MHDRRLEEIAAAERWFEQQGLPYFSEDNAADVRRALRRSVLVPSLVAIALSAVVAGVVAGWFLSGGAAVVATWATVATLVTLAAVVWLDVGHILVWALRHTFSSLGWFVPLVTRALPLLLLFITFLFINTEVWQVASGLQRSYLWLSVLMFATVAVLFLLARLPEEVKAVMDDADGDRLADLCQDTPVEARARELAGVADAARLSALQRANLTLVLLFSQAVQVLLLSVAVFCFFLVFGKIAITDAVIQAWLGTEYPDGTKIPSHLPTLGWLPVSNELFQVAVFLAAFSGLYFTVTAVTDASYREQFFSSLSREIEKAIGVHTVITSLRRG